MEWEETKFLGGLIVAFSASLLFAAWAFAKGLEETDWPWRRFSVFCGAMYLALVGAKILYFSFFFAVDASEINFLVLAALAGAHFWFAWRYWSVYRSMS